MKPGKQANQPEVCLPAPLARDRFDLLRDGISDDPKTSVLINAARDFAYLTPQPVVDYTHYQPRWRCSAPGSLDTSLSHAAGLIEIAACHA